MELTFRKGFLLKYGVSMFALQWGRKVRSSYCPNHFPARAAGMARLAETLDAYGTETRSGWNCCRHFAHRGGISLSVNFIGKPYMLN